MLILRHDMFIIIFITNRYFDIILILLAGSSYLYILKQCFVQADNSLYYMQVFRPFMVMLLFFLQYDFLTIFFLLKKFLFAFYRDVS